MNKLYNISNNNINVSSFPNQNVIFNRFLINHPQLSVNYYQKETYKYIINEKYNELYPYFVKPYTLYNSIYKPNIELKPN